MNTTITTAKKVHANEKGFTLIELLVVIGLLAALAALVLPSLSADREEALGGICDYNQAGTVRTMRQFSKLYNHFPNGFHTALSVTDADTSNDIVEDVSGIMPGMPKAQENKLGPLAGNAAIPLTANTAQSLINAGITELCYGTGRNVETVAAGINVISPLATWQDDSEARYSFDGIPVHEANVGDPHFPNATRSWEDYDDPVGAEGDIIGLWITPTIDWTPDPDNANNDWTGGTVEMEITLEGRCPIPAQSTVVDAAETEGGEVSFSYYIAYFKVFNADYDGDGEIDPAIMIGSTCPEDGILNP